MCSIIFISISIPCSDRSLLPHSSSIYSRWAHGANCNQTVPGGHRLYCIWCPRTHDPLDQGWHEDSQRRTRIQHPALRSGRCKCYPVKIIKMYLWMICQYSYNCNSGLILEVTNNSCFITSTVSNVLQLAPRETIMLIKSLLFFPQDQWRLPPLSSVMLDATHAQRRMLQAPPSATYNSQCRVRTS